MVDITPALPAGRQIINGYGDGGFRIGGERHEGSVVVFPERTISWHANEAGDLSLDSFATVVSASESVEILLVGTGTTMTFLAPAVRAALRDHGIVADVMTTAAACRTFNVLLAEDRRVAAALIAVP